MLDTGKGFYGFYRSPHIAFGVLPSDSSHISLVGLLACVRSRIHSTTRVAHPYPSLCPLLVLFPIAWLVLAPPPSLFFCIFIPPNRLDLYSAD